MYLLKAVKYLAAAHWASDWPSHYLSKGGKKNSLIYTHTQHNILPLSLPSVLLSVSVQLVKLSACCGQFGFKTGSIRWLKRSIQWLRLTWGRLRRENLKTVLYSEGPPPPRCLTEAQSETSSSGQIILRNTFSRVLCLLVWCARGSSCLSSVFGGKWVSWLNSLNCSKYPKSPHLCRK